MHAQEWVSGMESLSSLCQSLFFCAPYSFAMPLPPTRPLPPFYERALKNKCRESIVPLMNGAGFVALLCHLTSRACALPAELKATFSTNLVCAAEQQG